MVAVVATATCGGSLAPVRRRPARTVRRPARRGIERERGEVKAETEEGASMPPRWERGRGREGERKGRRGRRRRSREEQRGLGRDGERRRWECFFLRFRMGRGRSCKIFVWMVISGDVAEPCPGKQFQVTWPISPARVSGACM